MNSYWSISRKSDDILMISFSHIDVAAGKFAHPNALKDFPYSILHVNCPNNSFYVSEIPNVGGDVAAIATFLKARIAEVAPKKVVCYGSSMGAFGALLYGYFLDVDMIISLAPEVPLGLPGASSREVTKDPAIFHAPMGEVVLDLVRPGKTRLFALCGEKAPADLLAGITLRQRVAGGCRSIRNAFHSLSPFIEAVWGLDRFLMATIEAGNPHDFMTAYEGDALEYPDFVQQLYTLSLKGGDESAFLRLIDTLPEEASPSCQALALIAYAQFLNNHGRTPEALAVLRQAFACNPRDPVGAQLFFELSPKEFLSLELDDDYFSDMLQAYRLNRPPSFYRFAALISLHIPEVLARFESARGPLMRYPAQQAQFDSHRAKLRLRDETGVGARRALANTAA